MLSEILTSFMMKWIELLEKGGRSVFVNVTVLFGGDGTGILYLKSDSL